MTPGEKRPGRATAGQGAVKTTATATASAHKTIAEADHKPAAPTARFQEEGRRRCRQAGPDQAGARQGRAATTTANTTAKKK